MKQVLSVEQIKHLKKIGFDTSDGSMCFEWSEIGRASCRERVSSPV